MRLRPQAGALRLEARVRFVRRFHEACDSALSVYDQVIAEAPTLMGRSSKLPACVACNRPLPTKIQREPRRDDPAPPPPRETRPPLPRCSNYSRRGARTAAAALGVDHAPGRGSTRRRRKSSAGASEPVAVAERARRAR